MSCQCCSEEWKKGVDGEVSDRITGDIVGSGSPRVKGVPLMVPTVEQAVDGIDEGVNRISAGPLFFTLVSHSMTPSMTLDRLPLHSEGSRNGARRVRPGKFYKSKGIKGRHSEPLVQHPTLAFAFSSTSPTSSSSSSLQCPPLSPRRISKLR